MFSNNVGTNRYIPSFLVLSWKGSISARSMIRSLMIELWNCHLLCHHMTEFGELTVSTLVTYIFNVYVLCVNKCVCTDMYSPYICAYILWTVSLVADLNIIKEMCLYSVTLKCNEKCFKLKFKV